MTKKEQKNLDKHLSDIADKLILEGWAACVALTDEYYLRLLEIMRQGIDARIEYIKDRQSEANKKDVK